ncbi:sulfotransferase domain-containing protein [Sphingomonas mali]|uniref:sulfotransferase domain-containing protein n=1 Tax=Sphingomonas mali TaxID=40682 RepID=UPI000833CCAC|nr:sulfotransferase domain-containing protein [Sphingomonas mali]
MIPTIWLASYPKSGNTWFRILVANLWSNSDSPVDINLIESTDPIASARNPFDQQTLIDSSLMTNDEIDRLRPAIYAYAASGETLADPDDPCFPVRFVKAHDAYTLTDSGEPIMAGARGAAGAILFVRDPRDVASSFAHHMHCSIDTAISRMADPDFCFASSSDRLDRQFRQRLLGWSGFASSWLDQHDIPVHLIRYEDMLADTAAILLAALRFAGTEADQTRLDRAIAFASIDELRRQEAESGFREAPRKVDSFFRRGTAGGWRDDLSHDQIARIERDHGIMMDRLGYSRSATQTERE